MTTLAEAMAEAIATLKAAGIDSARADARVLAAHSLGLPAGEFSSPAADLSESQTSAFEAAISRRAIGEPVAYITGQKEFFGLDFAAGPGVLIPRPETETLVEEALRDFADPEAPLRVLDLGVGSGCLLIAFLVNRPNAVGTGIDQSSKALEWCKDNVLRHDLDSRCALQLADWGSGIEGQFEVIFSNPPYIETADIARLPADVRSFEPPGALDGGPDGLSACRVIASLLPTTLARGGHAYLEIGLGQHHMVAEIMEATGLEVDRIVPDLAGIPRCVVVSRGEPSRQSKAQKKVGNRNATR
ncbi:MAG TPA: peptide chain release factor N(5)-glutamine methyltransferase [Rhizomicrobium sp.]